MTGREVDATNVENVRRYLERLRRTRTRVEGQIESAEELLNIIDPQKMCWSCAKKTNRSTDLIMCELGNTAYPEACSDWHEVIQCSE